MVHAVLCVVLQSPRTSPTNASAPLLISKHPDTEPTRLLKGPLEDLIN